MDFELVPKKRQLICPEFDCPCSKIEPLYYITCLIFTNRYTRCRAIGSIILAVFCLALMGGWRAYQIPCDAPVMVTSHIYIYLLNIYITLNKSNCHTQNLNDRFEDNYSIHNMKHNLNYIQTNKYFI